MSDLCPQFEVIILLKANKFKLVRSNGHHYFTNDQGLHHTIPNSMGDNQRGWKNNLATLRKTLAGHQPFQRSQKITKEDRERAAEVLRKRR